MTNQSPIESQIAKIIYQNWMSNMKFTLDMEETHYESGRQDARYKFFKKMLMANTYENMRVVFDALMELGVIEKTKYAEDLKDGYKDTPSGGSGHINTKEFDDWAGL